jgi:hypothetical protein
MGFTSWQTADTKESIACCHAGHRNSGRAVYLLQPGGADPIEELAYEGYARFGGVDAFEWLARHNMPAEALQGRSAEDVHSIGLGIDVGVVLIDPKTGDRWSVYEDWREIVGGFYFSGRWNEVFPAFGASPNDLVESGRLVETRISALLPDLRPLKFSFRASAKYDDLPASPPCPKQGLFF